MTFLTIGGLAGVLMLLVASLGLQVRTAVLQAEDLERAQRASSDAGARAKPTPRTKPISEPSDAIL